ncbi:hypothetical protein PR048_032893 [Dryococelus australis]|uniref:Uncharacterized protein n=1 Tax=Dryococelus australis TaxID=614101 RepID=A0ABQ9G7N4_9NEOP|nr:hypothetical protein PR048_032893 [Dryococelus australis]
MECSSEEGSPLIAGLVMRHNTFDNLITSRLTYGFGAASFYTRDVLCSSTTEIESEKEKGGGRARESEWAGEPGGERKREKESRVSKIGSKIDTENYCTIRVQSWNGDRDEVHFEPPNLAVQNLDPRSAAIVNKCSMHASYAPCQRVNITDMHSGYLIATFLLLKAVHDKPSPKRNEASISSDVIHLSRRMYRPQLCHRELDKLHRIVDGKRSGWGKREISEKTRRPAASSGMILWKLTWWRTAEAVHDAPGCSPAPLVNKMTSCEKGFFSKVMEQRR